MNGRRFAIAAALVVLSCVALAARAPVGADYAAGTRATLVDSARPQIDALIRGDLPEVARAQPAQGPVSVVLRAPFAALAPAADVAARYRLGVFPCLLALGLAALVLLRAGRRRAWWQRVLIVALFLAPPVVADALEWGHPEDLLATALLVVGTIAGAGGLTVLAGLACGLAVATKAWALIVALPLALAARARPAQVLGIAAVVAIAAMAPLAIADSAAFKRSIKAANAAPLVHPADIWWTVSRRRLSVSDGGRSTRLVRAPTVPKALRGLIRPFLVVLGAALSLALARRRRLTISDAFLLLATLMLLRCVLDPGDNRYYHAPFLIFLTAWEVVTHRRPAIVALLAAALTATVPGPVTPHRDLANLAYLGWTLPALALMGAQLMRAPAGAGAAGLNPRKGV